MTEDPSVGPPVVNCRSNPHGGECCTHPKLATDRNGVMSSRQVCCWCGSGTEWAVVGKPAHGKQHEDKYHNLGPY